MKNQEITNQNMIITSDKTAEVIVKIMMLCSIVIVGCEFYILHKL